MEVKLISHTNVDNVLEYVGKIASVCYASNPGSYENVARACAKNGHSSVFEHMVFTFDIRGISRSCSHQLVRHRLASFTQESQRYVKVEEDDWYVTPDSLDDSQWFYDMMRDSRDAYEAFIGSGVKPEDARYVLPNAAKTNIVMTMNMRELMHFLTLRKSPRAQWEIRELAERIESIVIERFPELKHFVWNDD